MCWKAGAAGSGDPSGANAAGNHQAKKPADATHAVLGTQVAELAPDGRVLTPATFQLQRPAVMRERSHQHRADRLTIAVVPGEEIVPSQRIKEPLGSRVQS